MRRALTLVFLFVGFQTLSAAQEIVSPPRTEAIKSGGMTNEEAFKILTTRCTSCHQSESAPGNGFLSIDKLSEKTTVDLLTTVITKSKMPKAHRDFKSTKDGKKFLQWLNGHAK